MDWRDHIEQVPGVACGKAVFKGTRLTVEFVLERLSQGATTEELIANHPPLTLPMIRAALAFAVSTLKQDELLLSA
jgi:uncharacterized protein (DUF433 family)